MNWSRLEFFSGILVGGTLVGIVAGAEHSDHQKRLRGVEAALEERAHLIDCNKALEMSHDLLNAQVALMRSGAPCDVPQGVEIEP